MDRKKEIPGFPGATHASVVRAHEKDQGYLGEFNSRCYDVVRRIIGSHAALVWRREIKLLSDVMYYYQTIGCGTSTLGEEYCSIMRVDSRTNHSTGKLRNTMLAMLQALSPYVDAAAEAWGERQRGGMSDMSVEAQLLRVSRSTTRSSRYRYILWMEQWYARVCEKATQLVSRLPGRDTGASILLWIVENKSTLLRMHLALFYLFRVYYHIPKRILGIRYRGYGRQGNTGEPVTLYTILGMLLLSQASSAALMWTIGLIYRNGSKKRDRRIDVEEQTSDGVVLYDYQGNVVVRDLMAYETDNDTDHPSRSHGHKCPLCLSQRQVPTATPCGHVFCWTCIGEWCSKKPECPLCRSMALPSQLVVVRHADF